MIKLFKPTIKRKDMDSVLGTLVDEELGPGARNQELAKTLTSEFSAADTIVLRSYLRALIIALRSLQLKRGDRVVISPLSPPEYLWLLQESGLEPVFVDVDPKTACITAEAVKGLGSPAPDAVLIHEPLGNTVSEDGFRELSIPIIEDISQSYHSRKNGVAAGSLGSVVVISFEDDALVGAGGGAAVIVKDRKHMAYMKAATGRDLRFDLLPDINSALISNQLKVIDHHIAKQLEYLDALRQALMKTKHLLINEMSESSAHNGYSFGVLADSRMKDILKYVKKYKIETAMPFSECALTLDGRDTNEFPNSIPFILRAMIFPLYPLLSKDQLMTMVRVMSTLP